MTEEFIKPEVDIIDNSKETIKLKKNTKGYTWEIKLKESSAGMLDDITLERLDKINDLMEQKYGAIQI